MKSPATMIAYVSCILSDPKPKLNHLSAGPVISISILLPSICNETCDPSFRLELTDPAIYAYDVDTSALHSAMNTSMMQLSTGSSVFLRNCFTEKKAKMLGTKDVVPNKA